MKKHKKTTVKACWIFLRAYFKPTEKYFYSLSSTNNLGEDEIDRSLCRMNLIALETAIPRYSEQFRGKDKVFSSLNTIGDNIEIIKSFFEKKEEDDKESKSEQFDFDLTEYLSSVRIISKILESK